MRTNVDFAALYLALGLQAGCTEEQLRLAYRRRVRALHPDRGIAVDALADLQKLNRLYAAAVAFHRDHGRLPGAVPPTTPEPAAPAPRPHASGAHAGHRMPPAVEAGQTHGLLHTAVVAGLLLLAAFLMLRDAGQGPTLAIGMHQDRVRLIEGVPWHRDGDRWDYGPSWVGFRCHAVVDWYSSPLRPLRVDDPRPAAPADTSAISATRC